MADRLYIGSKYKELSDSLYNKKILYGEKTDIFMLAFAFGVHEGVRTPLKPKTEIVLEQVVKGKDLLMSLIYSVAVDELRKEGRENLITDTNVVYGIAEEYANTGFEIIKQMIPDFNKYDEEEFMLALIEIMDELM